MNSQSEKTKGSIPFGEPVENDPFSQIQPPSSNEKSSKDVADASVLFGSNDASNDFFSAAQPQNTSAVNFFDQQQTSSESFFDHLGHNSSVKSSEHVPQEPTSLIQAYDPKNNYEQKPEQYTLEQSNAQWQQFDPNVHYYYDEQSQLHYYDPNTNQEYDMSQYGYDYQYDAQYYPQEGYDTNAYVATGQDENTQLTYDPNYTATLNTEQQYPLGQENFDPNLYANPAENRQQKNYDPNLYAVVPENNTQYVPDQKKHDENEYTIDPKSMLENSQPEQSSFVQDNYNPILYADKDSKPHSQNQFVQNSYDPNMYTANSVEQQSTQHNSYEPVPESYNPNNKNFNSVDQNQQKKIPDQSSYVPDIYSAQTTGYEQNNYDPNLYTATSVGYEQSSSQIQEHQDHKNYESSTYSLPDTKNHENQEQENLNTNSYLFSQQPEKEVQADHNLYSKNMAENKYQSNEQPTAPNVFDFNQKSNQETKVQEEHQSQEIKEDSTNTGHPAVITAEEQTPDFQKTHQKDIYFPENHKQQNNDQSLEHLDSNKLSQNKTMFNVPSSEYNSTAVLDLNSEDFSTLVDNTTTQNNLRHEGSPAQPYYQEETLNKSNDPPVDVEYFNYQEQPYSSSNIYTSTLEQNELGAETPTAIVDLNSASFDNHKKQQESESQFAEVQLAPVSNHTEKDLAYDSISSNYQTTEQLKTYEPVVSTNHFEEVNFEPNAYAPTPPTTSRTMSPHRVSSPFGSMAPPERILSPLGRTSYENTSTRSSFEMKGSFIDRVASPVVPLVSCPDPQCEGENKPKAKFCCECGRPLASISRSNTPFSGTNTPFANFSFAPESQKNPLDEKKAEMVESLKSFCHSVLFDTNTTHDEKKSSILSYIDLRLSEFSNESGKLLLWKLVRELVEKDGSFNESESLNESIVELFGPVNGASGTSLLDNLEGFLLQGDREGACQFAMDNDMWDHALIIGQSTKDDLYKRVMTRFVDRRLSSLDSIASQPTEDKKYLRILYSLFSGTDIVPQVANKESYTKESLEDWKLTLHLALKNPSEHNEKAINSLGNALKQYELKDESNICYLLSPGISVLSGLDASIADTSFTDLDLLYIMDLYDFAVKGDAASVQIFKFIHAWWLADLGFEQESQHYRESIANAIGTNEYQPFIEKFKQVSRQLLESPSDNYASILSQSTLDTLIDTLEEKFKASSYGGYGYSMNNSNYHKNTTPFSYSQDTTYAPPENIYLGSNQPDSVEPSVYNYNYGNTPEVTANYGPETSYEPMSTNSYNPIENTYQPPDANVQPAYQNNTEETKTSTFHDDDGDLGFGNSSFQKSKGIKDEQNEEKKEEPVKEENKTEKSGGWGIFSLFSRKDTAALDEKKPVKANLGQENSFYYDEKEKRWVNKLNDTKPVAATPPPPPKASTPQPPSTIPPSTVQSPPSFSSNNAPPSRVNSAPVGAPFSSPSGTPTGFSTPPIGGSKRPGASGKKKPMRSRYVDVFNPPN